MKKRFRYTSLDEARVYSKLGAQIWQALEAGGITVLDAAYERWKSRPGHYEEHVIIARLKELSEFPDVYIRLYAALADLGEPAYEIGRWEGLTNSFLIRVCVAHQGRDIPARWYNKRTNVRTTANVYRDRAARAAPSHAALSHPEDRNA